MDGKKTTDNLTAEEMGINIAPCKTMNDISRNPDFVQLNLTSGQKLQMAGLMQQIPSLISASALSQAYVVKFPEGVQGHLMQYKTGRLGTPIQDANGKIIGHASLERATGQTAVLGAMNAMAVVSGQYFLSEISSKLGKISLSIDKILEFLYGDKRAELMAEVSFTKYAYENYSSIMEHGHQRTATITGLQEAKRVALKDIEFYMADLDSAVNAKDISDIAALVDKAFQIKDSLELSVQLCAMAAALEMYYARNFDSGYIDYVEKELRTCINKCDKRILTDFGALNTHVMTFKDKFLARPVNREELAKRVSQEIELRTGGGESNLQRSLCAALHAPNRSAEYYISQTGGVYLKTV